MQEIEPAGVPMRRISLETISIAALIAVALVVLSVFAWLVGAAPR